MLNDKYPNLKDRPTSEKHMPSFKVPDKPQGDAKKADVETAKKVAAKAGKDPKTAELFHATSARLTINCSECGLPRLLYSLSRLSSDEQDIAQAIIDEVSSFVCGATSIFKEDHRRL